MPSVFLRQLTYTRGTFLRVHLIRSISYPPVIWTEGGIRDEGALFYVLVELKWAHEVVAYRLRKGFGVWPALQLVPVGSGICRSFPHPTPNLHALTDPLLGP